MSFHIPTILHNPVHSTEYPIDTIGPPIQEKSRHIHPDLQCSLKEVKLLCDLQIMQPGKGSWSSAAVIAKERDDSIQLCSDYRKLNAITKKDEYPIPHLRDATARLFVSSVFSNFDITYAYHNIPVAGKDYTIDAQGFQITDKKHEVRTLHNYNRR